MKDHLEVIDRVAHEIFFAAYDPRYAPPKELVESWWVSGRDVGSGGYEAAVRQARVAIATLGASGLMQPVE